LKLLLLFEMFEIRQVLKSTYAFIIPEDAPFTGIPGWDGAKVKILAAPVMGCDFVEYLIRVNEESKVAVPVQDHPEYVFYILEGNGFLEKEGEEYPLEVGSYGYLPPKTSWEIKGTSNEEMEFLMVKKRYEPIGSKFPESIIGLDRDTPEKPGLPGRAIKNFVPYSEDILYDLSWFILYFDGGTGMDHAENHVHEHGLYMLSGESLYLLDETWYQTVPGDFIWMAPYVPQSCKWYGDDRGAYLLYSNRNRDPRI
jgi:(S)-ureidoglycine aminohydrolase